MTAQHFSCAFRTIRILAGHYYKICAGLRIEPGPFLRIPAGTRRVSLIQSWRKLIVHRVQCVVLLSRPLLLFLLRPAYPFRTRVTFARRGVMPVALILRSRSRVQRVPLALTWLRFTSGFLLLVYPITKH